MNDVRGFVSRFEKKDKKMPAAFIIVMGRAEKKSGSGRAGPREIASGRLAFGLRARPEPITN